MPKSIFEPNKVFTSVTAEEAEKYIFTGIYGYFANNKASLKQAVEENKQNLYCYYGQLTKIMPAENERRFVFNKDYLFALFYPTDFRFNKERY